MKIKFLKCTTVFLFISFFLFSCTFGDKKRTYKKSFRGVLIKNYRDYKNHGMSTFDLENGNYKFKVLSEVWPRCWEYAKIGDSIIKPADTLILIIKKPDGTEQKFNYNW
jgi:hypothetical protein